MDKSLIGFPIALALITLAVGSIFASQVFSQTYNNTNQTTKNPAGTAKSGNISAPIAPQGTTINVSKNSTR